MLEGHNDAGNGTLQVEDVDFDFPWFPQSHQLIITSHGNILSWDTNGIHELFRANSGGIVAAKRADREDGRFMAVADTEVIILHDIRDSMDENRSYRLKQAQADVCVGNHYLGVYLSDTFAMV